MNLSLQEPKGFSLLEVLIALIILSVALLGFAKAQAIAQHENQTAYWQSMATIQLNNLAEHVLACKFEQLCWQSFVNQWQPSIKNLFPQVETHIKQNGLVWQFSLTWYLNNNFYTTQLLIKP